jgi:CelD/BcsL family acetyltransferase involved in cellulose biosynthesis
MDMKPCGMTAGTVTVPLRFPVGEKVLWTWRPKLAVIEPAGTDQPPWEQVVPTDLGQGLDGLLCRQLEPGTCPVGVSHQGRWLCYVRRVEKLYFVDIQGDFEQYLARFSAKRRHNLKRSVRWFVEQSGGRPMTVAQEPQEMEEFQRRAVEISRQTYQERLLGAGLPAGDDFLKGMKETAHRGMARGYLLWCEGKPVAFAWCTGKGSRLNYGVIGYLPDYARMSPGTALLYLILEDLFRKKEFSQFDFGVGEAWYKESFATSSEEYVDAMLFRPLWRNEALVRLHAMVEAGNTLAGALLERLGWKKAVKRWMRILSGAGAA